MKKIMGMLLVLNIFNQYQGLHGARSEQSTTELRLFQIQRRIARLRDYMDTNGMRAYDFLLRLAADRRITDKNPDDIISKLIAYQLIRKVGEHDVEIYDDVRKEILTSNDRKETARIQRQGTWYPLFD